MQNEERANCLNPLGSFNIYLINVYLENIVKKKKINSFIKTIHR